MTSHQLAIAKASLLAGLLRPDPNLVSREEATNFHALLKAVTLRCSPQNVQRCKQWTLENIYQSSARSIALGKYLTAFAASLCGSEVNKKIDSNSKPSIKRQCLHILYLVNDILYHGKHRINDSSICTKIQPTLVNLVGSCASFKGSPKHHCKILDLIELWKENGYFSDDYVAKLRVAVVNAQEAGKHIEAAAELELSEGKIIPPKSVPYTMPASHGDPSTPWYDLPAGNIMPHITPNSTRPINPDLIKPLQFVPGPANESLALAVKKLLDNVQIMFDGETDNDEKLMWDIDELGQPVVLDEITGEIIDGEGYYGWSRSFCEKMKSRKNGPAKSGKEDRSGWYDRSVSSSPDTRKRRYNDSDDTQDRSRRRQRSYTSSRSTSPAGQRILLSRSRSNSRSRPRSPLQIEPLQYLTQKSIPNSDALPTQPVLIQLPHQFQHDLNPSFPPPPLPLPNMHFNGTVPPFGTWPPPPLNLNLNPQQFVNWPPAPFPTQPVVSSSTLQPSHPGDFQQQTNAYSFPAPNGWQENGGGHSHQFGWNGPPQGGGRGRGW